MIDTCSCVFKDIISFKFSLIKRGSTVLSLIWSLYYLKFIFSKFTSGNMVSKLKIFSNNFSLAFAKGISLILCVSFCSGLASFCSLSFANCIFFCSMFFWMSSVSPNCSLSITPCYLCLRIFLALFVPISLTIIWALFLGSCSKGLATYSLYLLIFLLTVILFLILKNSGSFPSSTFINKSLTLESCLIRFSCISSLWLHIFLVCSSYISLDCIGKNRLFIRAYYGLDIFIRIYK